MSKTRETWTGEALVDDDTYRRFVESVTSYAIYMLDPRGRVMTWNAGAARAKGYTAAEIVGRHFSCFYTPEDVAAGAPELALNHAFATGLFEAEGWRLRKDGERFWAHVSICPLFDDDNRLIGFAETTKDRTRERRLEAAARENERRSQILVQSVAEYSIYMLDPDGQVTNWNAGAANTTGFTAKEVIGQSFERFFTEEDRSEGKPAYALAMALEYTDYQGEGWRVRKDGSRFWAEYTIEPLYDAGRHIGFAKVTRDVTRQREAARHLQAMKAREEADRAALELALAKVDAAQLANEAKANFLSNISHELLTPLTAIIGFSGVLSSGKRLDERDANMVSRIGDAGRTLQTLINDLLIFSRIEADRVVLDPHQTDIRALVARVSSLFERPAKDKGLRLSLEVADGVADAAMVDGPRLGQVLSQLLGNAIKFTEAGWVKLAVTEGDEGRLRFEVADSGVGVPADLQARIFEGFVQADGSISRRFGGTGLGLAICEGLVNRMGGRIGVVSQPGHGSVFWFEVPLDESSLTPPRALLEVAAEHD